MFNLQSEFSPQTNQAKDNSKVRGAVPSRFKLISVSSKRLPQISALAPESTGYLPLGMELQRSTHLYNHQHNHLHQTLLVICGPTKVTTQLPGSSAVQDKRQAAVGSYVFPGSWLGNTAAEHISQHNYLGKSAEHTLRQVRTGLTKPPAFKWSPNNSRRKLPGLQKGFPLVMETS